MVAVPVVFAIPVIVPPAPIVNLSTDWVWNVIGELWLWFTTNPEALDDNWVLPAVELEASIPIVPFTTSFDVGFVVPIPKFPSPVSIILLVIFALVATCSKVPEVPIPE